MRTITIVFAALVVVGSGPESRAEVKRSKVYVGGLILDSQSGAQTNQGGMFGIEVETEDWFFKLLFDSNFDRPAIDGNVVEVGDAMLNPEGALFSGLFDIEYKFASSDEGTYLSGALRSRYAQVETGDDDLSVLAADAGFVARLVLVDAEEDFTSSNQAPFDAGIQFDFTGAVRMGFSNPLLPQDAYYGGVITAMLFVEPRLGSPDDAKNTLSAPIRPYVSVSYIDAPAGAALDGFTGLQVIYGLRYAGGIDIFRR